MSLETVKNKKKNRCNFYICLLYEELNKYETNTKETLHKYSINTKSILNTTINKARKQIASVPSPHWTLPTKKIHERFPHWTLATK